MKKRRSLGPYPDLSLADARPARNLLKRALRTGTDPGIAGRLACAALARQSTPAFETVSRKGFTLQRSTWSSAQAGDGIQSLEHHIFPFRDDFGTCDSTAPVIRKLLRDIAQRQAVRTARRIRHRMSSVVVHAAASGRRDARR